MGNILNPGDSVLGFDIRSANFNDADTTSLNGLEIPDVVSNFLVASCCNGIELTYLRSLQWYFLYRYLSRRSILIVLAEEIVNGSSSLLLLMILICTILEAVSKNESMFQ